jgi:phosphoribosylformylglycinamidine synthase
LIGDLGYHLTNTTYAEVCEGVHGGAIPNIDLNIEKQTGEFLQKIIDERILFSCGDISHGGLLTALAKMCVKGGVGANINLHHVQGTELVSLLFNEDNARYICTVPKDRSIDFINKAIENNIIYTQIGFTTGKSICVNSVHEVSIEECKKALSSLAEFFAG